MQVPTITKNQYTDEPHPWDWFIPEGTHKLFIGTFPTEKSNRKYDFFYSGATNRFWEVMTELAKPLNEIENEENEVEKRKQILTKLKLGLTDMGKRVLRQQGSSNDHSLFPLEFTDIAYILRAYPAIDTILVSGSSAGNSSLSWLGIYCDLNNIAFNAKEFEDSKAGTLTIDNKIFHHAFLVW